MSYLPGYWCFCPWRKRRREAARRSARGACWRSPWSPSRLSLSGNSAPAGNLHGSSAHPEREAKKHWFKSGCINHSTSFVKEICAHTHLSGQYDAYNVKDGEPNPRHDLRVLQDSGPVENHMHVVIFRTVQTSNMFPLHICSKTSVLYHTQTMGPAPPGGPQSIESRWISNTDVKLQTTIHNLDSQR